VLWRLIFGVVLASGRESPRELHNHAWWVHAWWVTFKEMATILEQAEYLSILKTCKPQQVRASMRRVCQAAGVD
jgi:hypothetical protein